MKESYYYPKKITFDFVPPWIAKMGVDAATGRTFVEEGLLTSRDSLKYFDEFLPDPNHQARYDQVADMARNNTGRILRYFPASGSALPACSKAWALRRSRTCCSTIRTW